MHPATTMRMAARRRHARVVGSVRPALGVLGLALTIMAAGAPAAGANLIYNPNFAGGLSGWRTVVVSHGADPGYPHVLALGKLFEPLRKCDRAQRGHHFLQMNVPAGAAAYVEESIIVPVHPGRLTFRTWGALDPVKVTISLVSGPFLRPLLKYTPPLLLASATTCSRLRPRRVSLDVSRFTACLVAIALPSSH